MPILRKLSIIIFYSFMLFSWQNLLPIQQSAWAQVTDAKGETEVKSAIDYYRTGLEQYHAGNYTEAVVNFQDAVSGVEKEERAYFWLGRLHHLGQGNKVNLNKAYESYLLAYQSGDAKIYNPEILQDLLDKGVNDAGYLLGQIYHDKKYLPRNDAKALQYFQKTADKGDAESLYRIGLIHYEGVQVEKSYFLAIEYLQKASKKDVNDAKILLGRIFYEGEGYVGKDPKRTIKHFTDSAKQGDKEGQYYLAGLYYIGDIVEQDYEKAIELFEASAKQDYAPSQYFLGQLYFHGHGVEQSFKQSLYWYQQAAMQEHVPAILRVAQFYRLGYGVAEDTEQALNYYKKAAMLGDADAWFQLAMMYHSIAGDLKIVIGLLYDAANQGHKMAQYNLGQFYRHGIGVTHDDLLAWVWFNIALNNGNDRAKQDIQAMQVRLSPQQIQQGHDYLNNWLRGNRTPQS